MNFDEWYEQAGRGAYAAFTKTLVHDTVPFDDLNEHDQQAWYAVARAVLAEGKIEVRPSTELAEQRTREENERLVKIARERAEDAQSYRDAADKLQSKLAGLRRAYDHSCAQRDKYERRTIEWRESALNGTKLGDVRDLVQTAIDRTEPVSWIAELKNLLDMDDVVRACTGCAGCAGCKR